MDADEVLAVAEELRCDLDGPDSEAHQRWAARLRAAVSGDRLNICSCGCHGPSVSGAGDREAKRDPD